MEIGKKMKMEKTAITIAVVCISVIVVFLLIGLSIPPAAPWPQGTIMRFTSVEEIKTFLKNSQSAYSSSMSFDAAMGMRTMSTQIATSESSKASVASAPSAADYSTTNIQVEGVDEADIVKNDGKYIYAVSGKKVVIIDAYPADAAKIISEIDTNRSVNDIFINGNRLVIFSQGYEITERTMPTTYPPYITTYTDHKPVSFIEVYDVSNREAPVLARNVSVDGSYYDSRMVGNYVYAVMNSPVSYGDDPGIPVIRTQGVANKVPASDVYYYYDVADYSGYQFTTILSINALNDIEGVAEKVMLTGYTQDMFVSADNIYTVYQKHISYYSIQYMMLREILLPALPADVAAEISAIRSSSISISEKWTAISNRLGKYFETLTTQQKEAFAKQMQEKYEAMMDEINKATDRTIVNRISIGNGKIEYKASGEFPGHVLNQFSMDEYNGYFRVASTTGEVFSGDSLNHIYVLDSDMKIVGKLEDLAHGEKIYSARFIGNRAYMVTFVKIDPLFVIDLSNPTQPTLLGELKIPGYSDYLHPYDENHIIGIGKEAVPAAEELQAQRGIDFAWYQGLKLSLFDVTDVEHPTELSKFNIGDRGTDSLALHEHKAFLFDRDKNLLVIPVSLAEIDREKYPGEVPVTAYGESVWNGAYVFELTLEKGFVEKGRVTHRGNATVQQGWYYYSSPLSVKRSLFMDDVLYTISDKAIKANSLTDMSEINNIELPYEQNYYSYLRY
ncbi:MAG: beta-propeller domain-containing protein [Candidatus Aenigmarchaeota archaeon]|nr:beta-propeller domain-containing protein [Candidatus Aenigmarchaeota archaeon]